MDQNLHDPLGNDGLCKTNRDSLVRDLRKIKEGGQFRLEDWTEFNHILSTAIRLRLNEIDSVRANVNEILEYLLDAQQLSSAWDAVTASYFIKSQSVSSKAALLITNGYRIIANFYGSSYEMPLMASIYEQLVCESFTCYVSKAHLAGDEKKMTAMAAITLLLPPDFQAELLALIVKNPNHGLVLVDYLPSNFALQSAYLFLRRKYLDRNRTKYQSVINLELNENEKMVLRGLVGRALENCSTAVVVDTFFMQKPFVPRVAEFIISLLPESCYVELLDSVGTLWGEKLFVSRGDERAQEYLTAALVSTLSRTSGDQLSRCCNDGLPIATILSAGVSTYLDQSDRRSRLRGMKIAKEFSVLLGHDIVFEELEEEEKRLELDKKQQLESPLFASSSSSAPQIESRGQPPPSYLDYDSSDSELEGYDCPVENAEVTVPLTNYLRVCLELLQGSDSDKDAHDKQLSALLSVPKIVMTSPVDAGDVCGPLVKELLRLSNSYNTQDFEVLRSAAVQALLVAYPHLSAPVLCGALEEESYPLSVRIFAISSLSRAAFTLSSIPSSASNTLSNTLNTPKAELSLNASEEHNTGRNPSTNIKLPKKLAASKKKVTYFVNNFGPVGPIFFYPILRLLAMTIQRNSSNVINKTKRNKLESQATFFDHATMTSEAYGKTGGSFIGEPVVVDKRKEGHVNIFVVDQEEGDGLHSMMPAEGLLALAAFTKCSVNTTCQSTFATETMKVAFMMKESTSLSVRRASLTALYSAFESWLHLKKNRMRHPPGSGIGVLESLAHLGPKGETSAIEREEYALVAMIVDWAVLSSKQDADDSCRALKLEVVRFAIEGFGLLEGEDGAG